MPELRRARPSDLDAVVDLLALRSRAAFGISEVERRHVEHAWSLEGTDAWVALERGAVVGYAELHSSQSLDVAARDPAAGDELLALVESRARERGFAFVACVVAAEDDPFCSLVERGRFEHLHDVLRMWRRLDGDLPSRASPTTSPCVRTAARTASACTRSSTTRTSPGTRRMP